MTSILQPGFVYWDGFKYILQPNVSVVSTPTGPAGGDLTGAYPNPTIAKLQGIVLTATSPAVGNVLSYNGSTWAPSALNLAGGDNYVAGNLPATNQAAQNMSGDVNGFTSNSEVVGLLSHNLPSLIDGYLAWTGTEWSLSSLPNSLPPSGSAGGDLSGIYPNPEVTGLLSKPLPSLASGFLEWNGTAWAFGSGGSSITWSNDLVNSTNTAQYVSSLSYSLSSVGGPIAINGTNTSLMWATNNLGPFISQTNTTSQVTGSNITIQPQQSNHTTNNAGGNVIIALQAPNGDGYEASLEITRDGYFSAAIGPIFGSGSTETGIWLTPNIVPNSNNYSIGTTSVSLGFNALTAISFAINNTLTAAITDSFIFPVTDLQMTLGSGGSRFLELFSQTGISAGTSAIGAGNTFNISAENAKYGSNGMGGSVISTGGAGDGSNNGGIGLYAVGGSGNYNGTALQAGQNGNTPSFYVNAVATGVAGIWLGPLAGLTPSASNWALRSDGSNTFYNTTIQNGYHQFSFAASATTGIYQFQGVQSSQTPGTQTNVVTREFANVSTTTTAASPIWSYTIPSHKGVLVHITGIARCTQSAGDVDADTVLAFEYFCSAGYNGTATTVNGAVTTFADDASLVGLTFTISGATITANAVAGESLGGTPHWDWMVTAEAFEI
jgi:hypothetical protein